MLAVPEKDQDLILKAIADLPPDAMLEYLNHEQQSHWLGTKQAFQRIHLALKSYFSGQPSPLWELSQDEQEIYNAYAEFYISLYGVIQWAWRDIEELVDGFEFPKSPGEALVSILELDAQAQMFPCLQGRYDFRPKRYYELYLKQKKYDKGTLSPKQEQSLDAELKRITKPMSQFASLEAFCIYACESAVKIRKNKVLRQKLQEYKLKREALLKKLNKHFRDVTGYAWESGLKKLSSQKGGTYTH